MKRLLQQYSTAGWVILSTGIVLFALLITIARLVLPATAAYRGEIERFLGRTIDHPVTIGSMQARWMRFSPHIFLRDVKVLDQDHGPPLLTLGEVYLKIDWVASVWRRTPVIDSLAVTGSTLGIVRRTDGSIAFEGFDTGGAHDLAWLRKDLLKRSNLTLQWLDSRVRWRDEASGAEHLLEGVDISMVHRQDRYRAVAYAALPPALGKDIELIAEIRSENLDRDSLQGKVYARARGLRVDELAALGLPGIRGEGGNGALSFELWSQWREGRPSRVSGRIDMGGVEVDPWIVIPGMERHPERIDRLSVDGLWAGGSEDWRLDLENITLRINGRAMPGSEAALAYRTTEDGSASWRGQFDALSLEGLASLVSRHRSVAGFLNGVIGEHRVEGTLRDVLLVLRLRGGLLERFGVSADFEDLGLVSSRDLPSVAGLDGQLSLDQDSGEVSLESSSVAFELPALFPDPLYAEVLNGDIEWHWDGFLLKLSTGVLSLDNDDIRIDLSADACWGNGTRRLDLQAAFHDGDGSALERYLPVGVMKPPVARWLRESILDGQVASGGAVLRGDLANFPFDHDDGEFSAWARIRDGVLMPRPTDLRIEQIDADLSIEGRSLALQADHASLLGLALHDVRAEIPVLNRARLSFTGEAEGPFAGIASVLGAMQPKAQRADGQYDFDYSGNGALTLDLQVPLARALRASEKPRAKGSVRLADVGIGLGHAGLDFEGVDGLVHFSPEDGIRGHDLTGRLAGLPVSASLAPGPDKSTAIRIHGGLDAGKALAEAGSPIADDVSGEARWTAEAIVSRFRKGTGRKIDLTVESDLAGVSVELPAPLGKAAPTRRPLSLATTITTTALEPIRIQYGDGLSTILAFSRARDGLEVNRGEVLLGKGTAALPTDGFRIRGNTGTVPVDAWMDWYAGFLAAPRAKGASPGLGAVARKLNEVDISVDALDTGGWQITDFRLAARKRYRAWSVETTSSLAAGTIQIPGTVSSARPVRVQLDYLDLPTPIGPGEDRAEPAEGSVGRRKGLNPGKLPPLKVRIDRVSLGERELGELRLQTSRVADGMHIHDLEVRMDNIVAHATGDWRSSGAGRQGTTLFFKVESPDLGAAFQHLELDDSLEGGRADLEFNISWPDVPYRPGFQGLRARGSISIADGRILNIEPGLGRVLGLINPAVLQRRFTLDFRDMFKKGFAFDSIKGNLVLVGSDLYTRDLAIKGPSSEIEISGRTGLVARDYDQVVAVTPQLGLGPTIAGAVIGGPAVGAAVFVAERLLKQTGADLSSVSRIELKVTGPWDDIRVRPANLGDSGDVELFDAEGD
ncbi:MAG: TIGR02099 family protein [Gammaproteobacteria bacterium]|nr:TIGR02099 family protein [Gammaproteobacteria bacterium]